MRRRIVLHVERISATIGCMCLVRFDLLENDASVTQDRAYSTFGRRYATFVMPPPAENGPKRVQLGPALRNLGGDFQRREQVG